MKDFVEMIDGIAKKIVDIEKQRKRIGDVLRQINETNLSLDEEILEEKIIVPIERIELNDVAVAGIDGGLVKRSLHGIDMMLLRAMGVLFYYKNNKLEKVDYYPDSLSAAEPRVIMDPFSNIELELNSNMERQMAEVKTATEVIEKFKPDVLLMDGSVVPHYTERPRKNSILYPVYQRMIESYIKLFEAAKRNNTILAGVIEDSRGARFCELLNEKFFSRIPSDIKFLLNTTKDTNLLTYALKLQERSFVFRYSSEPSKHPVLKEFGPVANQIFTFYLKTAEFDRPIRIDFLSENIDIANKLSSIILATTGHAGYGFPSVLIEADQRAKLSEEDLEFFYSDLINKAGNLPGLMDLRRKQRPF